MQGIKNQFISMFKAVLNVPPAEPMDIRWFYNKYAAMLLGYINGVIQDHQKSEEQLALILKSFAREFNVQENNNLNMWFQLRQYAQNKLSDFSVKADQPTQKSKNLDLLNDQEKLIFCAVYYHGKSISYLGAQVAKDESEIRNLLKLSIDKIRRARGN